MRVGVKFCGNCNPLVDMGAVLRQLTTPSGDVRFVSWSEDDYVALLVLNGCSRDCASRPAFAGPVIVATDTTVDRWPVDREQLPAAIMAAVRARTGPA